MEKCSNVESKAKIADKKKKVVITYFGQNCLLFLCINGHLKAEVLSL